MNPGLTSHRPGTADGANEDVEGRVHNTSNMAKDGVDYDVVFSRIEGDAVFNNF